MIKQRIIWLLFVFFIIFISASWSLELNKNLSTDYGVYYVGSSLFSTEYKLYGEHFDHKGPGYYFFLTALGRLIGFGSPQAIISLFLTTILYLGTVYMLAKKNIPSKLLTGLVVIVTANTLFQQSANASIAIFQTTLLIWSVYFLHQYTLISKNILLFMSLLFWTLAVFTRADSLTYGLLFLLVIILTKKYLDIIKTLIFASLLYLLFFVFFSYYFGFNVQQYWDHNFLFNSVYNSGNIFLRFNPDRTMTFQLFMTTGIPLLLVLSLSTNYFTSIIKSILKKYSFVCRSWRVDIFFRKMKNLSPQTLKHSIPFLIAVFSIFTFIYSGSDKNYHIFIIYPGVIYFLIATIRNIKFSNNLQFVFVYLILLVPSMLIFKNGVINFVTKFPSWHLFSIEDNLNMEVVDELENSPATYGVFTNAWIYLIANTKPMMGLVPDVIYFQGYGIAEAFYPKTQVSKFHEKLISQIGARFIIQQPNPSIYAEDLLQRSILIRNLGDYELREINNPKHY